MGVRRETGTGPLDLWEWSPDDLSTLPRPQSWTPVLQCPSDLRDRRRVRRFLRTTPGWTSGRATGTPHPSLVEVPLVPLSDPCRVTTPGSRSTLAPKGSQLGLGLVLGAETQPRPHRVRRWTGVCLSPPMYVGAGTWAPVRPHRRAVRLTSPRDPGVWRGTGCAATTISDEAARGQGPVDAEADKNPDSGRVRGRGVLDDVGWTTTASATEARLVTRAGQAAAARVPGGGRVRGARRGGRRCVGL